MKTILLLLSVLLFSSATAVAGDVRTVSQFDLDRYLGTWHEIARFPARFQRGCKDAKAVYRKISDSKISVVNSCKRDGKTSVAEGNAVVRGTGKLGVRFSIFQPFRAPYWVLWLDEQYNTIAVGEPGRKFGWILSRTPMRTQQSVAQAVEVLQENGYDTSRLVWN